VSKTIKIFISSPSDVRPERMIAERVVARLDREFAYHFRVEALLWEHEPLIASHHFQDVENIPAPSSTDIVVVILWSRLGVMLPQDRFVGAVSGKAPVSGTEWEFEDALAGYQRVGQPNLLLYRKQAPITASLDDEARLEEIRAQKRLVDEFLKRWFMASDGTFTAASTVFPDETQFEEKLEADLRQLLRRQLTNRTGGDGLETPTVRWHAGSPFRGLESFQLEHAPIFFGRTRARNELRSVLARRAEVGCAFVMVMGASGSGKSSLVRAALLPDLLLPGMIGTVGLVRYAVMRPSDGSGDIINSLAAALMSESALPELAQLQYTVEGMTRLLASDPSQVTFAMRQGLMRAAESANLTQIASARLVLVVDQMEEILTADSLSKDIREAFIDIVDALARSGLVWVVATMRSDFFEQLTGYPKLAALSEGDGKYLLAAPVPAEIAQIIRQPAREAGLTFEAAAADGESLDDVILAAAASDPDSLPLLEFLLAQLWERREGGLLSFSAYQAVGGLEGALGQHAQHAYEQLPGEVRAAFATVLRALVTVRQDVRGGATARNPLLASFAPGSPERRLIDRFASASVRLLVIDGSRVRLAHESLLTHWPLAASTLAEAWADIQLRAKLEQEAVRWHNAGTEHRASLLLRPGLPLIEAEDLQQRRGAELDAALVDFISASSASARSEQQRQIRRARVLLAAASGSALVFLILAGFAGINWYVAKRSVDAAAVAITTLVESTSEIIQPIAQLERVQQQVDAARGAIEQLSAVTADPRLATQRARTLLVLAELEEARGQMDAMRKDAADALAAVDGIAGRGDREAGLQRVRSERLLGTAEAKANHRDDARKQYERALADLEGVAPATGSSADEVRSQTLFAEVNQYLGDLSLEQFNDPASAETWYQHSYETRLALSKLHDAAPQAQHDVAWAANKLGDVQVSLGQDEAALKWFDLASEGYDALGDHLWDNVDWPYQQALVKTNIGLLQSRQKNFEASIQAFEAGKALLTDVKNRDPKNIGHISALGWNLSNEGETYYVWWKQEPTRQERLRQARSDLLKGLDIRASVANAAPTVKYQMGAIDTRAHLAAVEGAIAELARDYGLAGTQFESAARLTDQNYEKFIYQYARKDTPIHILDLVENSVQDLIKAGQPERAQRLLKWTHDVVVSNLALKRVEPDTAEALTARIERDLASLSVVAQNSSPTQRDGAVKVDQ
jgi:tetratricopeptide (TPR) repeat protein/ABC-type multidrug transport system fused ATPase/permease subunit